MQVRRRQYRRRNCFAASLWAAFGLLVAAAPCSHHMRRRCLPAQLPSCMQRRASAPRCMCPAMDGMDHGPVPTADGARCTMATGVDAVHGRGRRAAAARAVRARMHDA
jgi:hypothetical protein